MTETNANIRGLQTLNIFSMSMACNYLKFSTSNYVQGWIKNLWLRILIFPWPTNCHFQILKQSYSYAQGKSWYWNVSCHWKFNHIIKYRWPNFSQLLTLLKYFHFIIWNSIRIFFNRNFVDYSGIKRFSLWKNKKIHGSQTGKTSGNQKEGLWEKYIWVKYKSYSKCIIERVIINNIILDFTNFLNVPTET